MKNTGIVRRIDELGRVVIPKELRRTMHIKEGEEMEVYVAPDDTLVLKKYSALRDYADLAKDYVDILKNHTTAECFVCDGDVVVASTDKKAVGKRIAYPLEQLLEKRKPILRTGRDSFSPVEGSDIPREIAITPVVSGGDVLGGVVISGANVGETGQKLTEVTAGFLAKQFE